MALAGAHVGQGWLWGAGGALVADVLHVCNRYEDGEAMNDHVCSSRDAVGTCMVFSWDLIHGSLKQCSKGRKNPQQEDTTDRQKDTTDKCPEH